MKLNIIKRKKSKDIKKIIPNFGYKQMLDDYDQTGDISNIFKIYWGLLSDDIEVKRRALSTISNVVSNFNKMKLISFDKQFRERSSFDWLYNWDTEEIESLLIPDLSIDDKIYIIGISSFHPNGYFREKAVKELMKYQHTKVIPFMIIRLNDWVPNIRYLANDYLVKYLSIGNISEVLMYFHLFKHIENYTRYESNEVIANIDKLFEDKNNMPSMLNNINKYDEYTRYYVYSLIYMKSIIKVDELVVTLLDDSSGLIRAKTFNLIKGAISNNLLISIKNKMLSDKSFKVRVLCIIELYNRGYFTSVNDLLFGLLDKHSSVREITRYYLRKLGYNDFIKFYLKQLDSDTFNIIGMLGLTEVATKDEFNQLEKQLSHSKIIVVKKSLKSISIINFEKSLKYILDGLSDERIGVSNEARRILLANIGLFNSKEIYKIFRKNKSFHIIRNAAIILSRSTKWESISYIFEILSNNNNDVSRIGEKALQSWIASFNNSFTNPNQKQLANLKSKYNLYKCNLETDFIIWFDKLVEDMEKVFRLI